VRDFARAQKRVLFFGQKRVRHHKRAFSKVCERERYEYRMASISRIDKIIGLFCKRDFKKRLYSAKLTYNFIDPTDCSHPICVSVHMYRPTKECAITTGHSQKSHFATKFAADISLPKLLFIIRNQVYCIQCP